MDEKVVRFDLSPQRLYELAEKKFEEKDYIAALRILRKSAEENGAGSDELALFADIYDEMEIFDESANYWFYFLEQCSDEEAIDACEGLAACYYNLGNDLQAAYYYNLMIQNKFYTPEDGLGLSEMFSSAPPVRKPFKIVYPPEEADYSETVDAGLKALKSGDYAKAEEAFLSVHPKADYYMSAQNFLAVCYLMQGKNEQAEKVCRALLEKEPDDVQVLSTYAAVLTETDRREESRAVAERLAAFDTQSADELYKIATVCCENGLYEQAFEKFCLLEKQVSYDLTLLYFKGVAAFRCGKTEESLQSLGKILDIFPDSAVTRYYYNAILQYFEQGGQMPETSFFYRIPQEEREVRLSMLKGLSEMPSADVKAFFEAADMTEIIDWCFDEADGAEPELQLFAMRIAVRGGMIGKVRRVLLDHTVNDIVKIETVRALAEQNRLFSTGIVLADIFRKVYFTPLRVGKVKQDKFIYAYATCFAHFALIGDGDCDGYRVAAENIYAALAAADKLSLASDADSLASAVYLSVSSVGAKHREKALELTGGRADRVNEILSLLQGEAGREAAAADAEKETEKE